jgi:hypothetical protein
MSPIAVIIGFVPLELFAFLNGPLPVAAAAAVGAVTSLVIALATAHRGTPTLSVVQVISLGAISAIAFAGGTATRHFLAAYGGSLSSMALGGYMLLTAPFAPFTAAIARAGVPRDAWASPRFLDTNRRISAVWGVAVFVPGLILLTVTALGSTTSELHSPLLRWGPAVVLIIFAVRYTERTVTQAHTNQPVAPQPPGVH